MTTLKGTVPSLSCVQFFLFLAFSSVNVFIFHITWLDTFWTMTPQSPPKQAPWDLTQFSQLSSAVSLYFPEFHPWSEISSLSRVILVLGKARSCRAQNLGCKWADHLGDLMFYQKTAQNVRHERAQRRSAWPLGFCLAGSCPPALTLLPVTSVFSHVPLVPFQLLSWC